MNRLQRVFLLSLMMLFVAVRANAVMVFKANLTIGLEPVLNPPTSSYNGSSQADTIRDGDFCSE